MSVSNEAFLNKLLHFRLMKERAPSFFHSGVYEITEMASGDPYGLIEEEIKKHYSNWQKEDFIKLLDALGVKRPQRPVLE